MYLCMNKKKNVSEVFAQNGSPGKKKLDIMLLLKIHFISFYAVASPFSLLLYRSVPSKTYTVEQTLDQLRSISINATKKLQYFLINVLTVALTLDRILLSEKLPYFQVVFLDWLSRLHIVYL